MSDSSSLDRRKTALAETKHRHLAMALGGSIAERESDGQALFEAIGKRDIGETARLIFTRPWVVTARNHAGATPLYIAAAIGWSAIVENLILHGADINARLPTDEDILTVPGSASYDESVHVLIRKRASEGGEWREGFCAGETPLMAAIKASGDGHPNTRKDDPHWQDVYANCMESLQCLIDHGAPLDFTDKCGYSPLTLAMEFYNYGAFEMLLKAGADPNYETTPGFRALDSAVIGDEPTFTKMLLDYGADAGTREYPAWKSRQDEEDFSSCFGPKLSELVRSRGYLRPLDYAKPGSEVYRLLTQWLKQKEDP